MGALRTIRASLVATTVAAVGGLLFGASSFASAGPPDIIPTCAGLAKSHIVYRAGRVVVYRHAVERDGGPHDWACPAHPHSRMASASGLGIGTAGGFAPGAVVGQFASVGPWLVDVASSRRGWSSCVPGQSGSSCRRHHHEVELTDVADGSQTSTTSAAHISLHVSALPVRNGHRIAAVVWTQPARHSLVTIRSITVRDSRGSAAFGLNPPVTGKIVPSSVRLHGLKLSFIENGRRRTIKLGV